jgi:hypothetical protein
MTWEPSSQERKALNDCMGPPLGHPERMDAARDRRARAVEDHLRAVGPLIAARALRDMAAEVVEGAAADSPYNQGFALRLRRRADEIEREAR